jgi:hypothetical protein
VNVISLFGVGSELLCKSLSSFFVALSQAHAVGKWHLGGNRFMNTPVGSTWGFETFTGLIQLRFVHL